MAKFLKLIRNSEGATAIEYGLIAALIAVAAITAMQGLGGELTVNTFGERGLQGVAFDITETKEAHAAGLQQAVSITERRYRDLVERLGARML